MSIIVETCPKCGAELQNIVIATFPPIPKKQCYRCGWSWMGKPEKIVYQQARETMSEGENTADGFRADSD